MDDRFARMMDEGRKSRGYEERKLGRWKDDGGALHLRLEEWPSADGGRTRDEGTRGEKMKSGR
jgi:hypothetical protein